MTAAAQLRDLLEPGSLDFADPRNPQNESAQLSIAISLKRIADTLCGDDEHCSFGSHLETMLFNLAQRMGK